MGGISSKPSRIDVSMQTVISTGWLLGKLDIIVSRYTLMCCAAQVAGALHCEYIDRKKKVCKQVWQKVNKFKLE